MTLDQIGKIRINKLHDLIEMNGLALKDSVTLDNDQRSIIQIRVGDSFYDTYSPYEAFHVLKDNNHLQEEK